MKVMVSFLFASLVISGCGRLPSENDCPDLQQYIAEIRADGMSEFAGPALRTVVSIHLGQSSLSYFENEASGLFWPRYQSNTCPNPATPPDEVKRLAELNESRLAAEISRVAPFADSDNSGFITTQEARYFRKIYEFGHEYEFVVNELDGDWSRFGPNRDMSESDLGEWVAEYNKIAVRALAAGYSFLEPIEL